VDPGKRDPNGGLILPAWPTAPRVETQAERMEAIRRRGLELLRAGPFPKTSRPHRLAPGGPPRTARRDHKARHAHRNGPARDGGSIVPPAPLPERPAASKPAEAKEKHAVKERPGPSSSCAACFKGINVIGSGWRMPKYVQVPGAPQVALGGGLRRCLCPDNAGSSENGFSAGRPSRIVQAKAPAY